MINFIIDRNVKNVKQKAYSIYYLTRYIEDDISIGYEVKAKALNIFYGVEPKMENSIYIPNFEIKSESPNYVCKYKNYEYVNFEKSISEYFSQKDGKYYFEFDIINTAFYFISCKQEYDISSRDGFDRFLSKFSLISEISKEPVFDNFSKMLLNIIQRIDNSIKEKSDKFRILLTHDVDNVNSRNIFVLLHFVKQILNGKEKSFKERVGDLLKNTVSNRYMMIDKCIELEKKYNGKSEFYFIQGKKGRYGSRYSVNELKKVKNVFSQDGDFVAGIHTNFYSYENVDNIKNEKSTLENYFKINIKSCRNHYLRFKVPVSWSVLYDCGIEYDTTLGYSDTDGFRAGTSKCFLPYDVMKNEKIDILEIPMINMDVVEMEKNKSFEEKWISIKEVIDKAKSNNSVSSILWHQCSLSYDDYYKMYEKILKYIAFLGGKFINYKDLVDERKKQIKELDKIFNQL